MSRDYAKRSSSRNNKSVPGWVWMTVGLLVGLFVAFLVYLNQAQLPGARSAPPPKAERPASGSKRADSAKEQEPEQARLNFDFYNMLPEFEVPVPEQERESAKPPRERERRPVIDKQGVYIIQAGSFRKAKDADTRKAQLALLGIVSKVQKVTIDGSKTWHRVRVGPYDNVERLNQVRALLKENSIDYMLLKQRS